MLLQLPQAVVSAGPDPDPEASIYPKPPFPQAASFFPSFLECHGRDEAPLRSPLRRRPRCAARAGDAEARGGGSTDAEGDGAGGGGGGGGLEGLRAEREALRLCAVM